MWEGMRPSEPWHSFSWACVCVDVAWPLTYIPCHPPCLPYRSSKPCNAETPAHILAGNLITPTELFYVRWVPQG